LRFGTEYRRKYKNGKEKEILKSVTQKYRNKMTLNVILHFSLWKFVSSMSSDIETVTRLT
jgi:hypothetical protein